MSRLVVVLPLLTALACVTMPPVHPNALRNNELCAQKIVEGDLTRAEVYCDLGLEFSPQYADLYVNKGLISLRRNDLRQAKEMFIKAIRYNQEQAQAYNNLGYIYLKEKAFDAAMDNFKRALKVNPDYLEARYNLALTHYKKGNRAEALKEYRTILAVNAKLADPYHDMGVMALEENKLTEATTHLKQAVELDPTFADAWFNLGVAYEKQGQFSEAKNAYVACLEAAPEHANCRVNLPNITRKATLIDPELKQLEATQSASASPESLFQLAQTYRSKGLTDQEERIYKRCLELDPRYPPCHYGRFEIASAEKRLAEAEIACKNFIRFAAAEEFPLQVQSCEKYLRSSH